MSVKLIEGIATVCCVCYPGNTILDVNPEWKAAGVKVSHSLCQTHLRLLYPQEYLAMKKPATTSAVAGTVTPLKTGVV